MTQQAVDLQIGGMTCASCAARIEKKLNRMPGVAGVGQLRHREGACGVAGGHRRWTRRSPPSRPPGTRPPLPEPPRRQRTPSGAAGSTEPVEDPEVASLRRRLIISAALTVPVLVLAMVPPLQFDNWQWLSLTLAAPVVVWGAWPFHRAAWINLRHGAATMDTLISVGVLAAFGWSLYALFFGDAGMPGMRMTFRLLPEPGVRRERDLPGGRRRGHRVHPGRPVFRGPREEAVRCGAAGADGHGREGRCGAAGRPRAADPGRPTRGR